MKTTDKVDRSRDSRIIRDYTSGIKVNDIAAGLGVTRTRLYQIIKRLRAEGKLTKLRRRGMSAQTWLYGRKES